MAEVADLIGIGAPTTWLDNSDNVKVQPSDAADATRPDIWRYEGLKYLGSGVGPAGEAGITIMDSYGTDWRFARITFNDLPGATIPAVDGNVWDATTGRVVQRHFVDAGVVNDAWGLLGAGYDLLEVHSGDQRSDTAAITVVTLADTDDTETTYTVAATHGATSTVSDPLAFADILDKWVEFETCWLCSTTTSSADGHVEVRMRTSPDGVTWTDLGTVVDAQGVNLATNPSAHRVGATVYGMGIAIGNIGIPGKFYYAKVYDDGCAFVPPEPGEYEEIENVSDPCCGSGSDAPTTGVTGDIPTVNPHSPYSTVSSTTCVGGGTVPTASDLTDTENWVTMLGRTPDVLCELIATEHPDTLGSTTYRWSDKPLDVPASSAFVEGRVRRGGWSVIRRAMALPDQYPEVSRAGVTIDESDALIRTLLDTESTAYLVARDWVQRLISETGRKASTAMRTLFRGVVSSLNPGPGRTYTIEAEDQITSPGGVFDLDKVIPQAVMDHTFFGPGGDDGTATYPVAAELGEWSGQLLKGLHKDLVGTPIPIIAGLHSDRGAVAIDGQSAEKGAVPCIWTRDCYLPGHGTQIFGELLICLGEIAGIEDIFGSDVGYDSGVPAVPARASKRINLNETVGVDTFSPSDVATWPFANPYIERTVGDQTLRYTAIYARGPRMEDHRNGQCTYAVNVCGPMGDNDLMMDQAGPLLQWFYNEHVALNEGRGYRSGEYHTLATYVSDATVPYLQPTTFDAFQDYTIERIGGDGYKLAFQLREQTTLRELEKRFMQDLEISLPFNHHGQKMLCWIDDLADPTTGTLYRERIEIDEPLPPYRDAHDEVENRVGFICDYDHDLQLFRREPEFLEDENSILAHRGVFQGGTRLSDGQAISPIEVYSTHDIDTVRDVFARRLLRKRKAPRYQEIQSNLAALHNEIGEQIRVTHTRGVGSTGYDERPFYVLEQRHNPNRHTVVLRGMDISSLVYGVGAWTDDPADDWDDADAAERTANSFWASDDGTIPSDSVPAKEWR